MSVSVVIPAFNSERTLEACLQALIRLDVKPLEILVINDGSTDTTQQIASLYPVTLINHGVNKGLPAARQSGLSNAKADIVLYLDSDVICKTNLVRVVQGFFDDNPEYDAVTGMLSHEHPHTNVWTCYKNISMHYNFLSLPKRITFLYGSVFALRRDRALEFRADDPFCIEDTCYGQRMHAFSRKIGFCADMAVSHLHKHCCLSACKSGWVTTAELVKLFFKNKGWRKEVGNRGSFASAPQNLLLSLPLSLGVFMGFFVGLYISDWRVFVVFFGCWMVMNFNFFSYCFRREPFFTAIAIPFTCYTDHVVRGFAVIWGAVEYVFKFHGNKL